MLGIFYVQWDELQYVDVASKTQGTIDTRIGSLYVYFVICGYQLPQKATSHGSLFCCL